MARMIWKGAISFGLVHVPVQLYPATRTVKPSFRLLDKRSLDPVGYRQINKRTGKAVPREDIVRGYEYEKERYVILTDEEIRAANPESTQTVDILTFVDDEAVSFLYLDTPYYLVPDRGGEKVYALLRDALKRSGKIGIALVVMRDRQHLGAVIPVGPLLALDTLRWQDELRPLAEIDAPAADAKKAGVSAREFEMAAKLIDDMSGDWSPDDYHDTFRDDILALVDRKVREGRVEQIAQEDTAPARRTADIVDLTELLKRSLGRAKGPRRAPDGGANERGDSGEGGEGGGRGGGELARELGAAPRQRRVPRAPHVQDGHGHLAGQIAGRRQHHRAIPVERRRQRACLDDVGVDGVHLVARHARAREHFLEQSAAARDEQLRQLRQLEEAHIVRAEQLVAAEHRAHERARVRHRHRRQRAHRGGMPARERPCDRGAPVVPDDVDRAAAEPLDQRDDVADEMRHPVRADAAGAGERRVAALVRRDRAIAVGIQPRRDARPALRRLRPAVQQHDDLAVERARIDGVESQSIVVERGDAARFIQGRFS